MRRSVGFAACIALVALFSTRAFPGDNAGEPSGTDWIPKPRVRVPEPAEWKQVLTVSVVNGAGKATGASFAATRVPPKPYVLTDESYPFAATFELPPSASSALAPGKYKVVATLAIPASDTAAGWTGTISNSQRLTVDPIPGQKDPVYLNVRYMQLIRWYVDHDDPTAAMKEANAWVADVPDSVSAYAVRGDLYFVQQKWELAIADHDAAAARMKEGGDLEPPFMKRRAEAQFKLAR